MASTNSSLRTLALGIVLGGGMGWWFFSPASAEKPVVKSSAEARDEAAQRLLQDSANEIARITDADERQKRAEDLLEKILKLFMVDLSLRLRDTPTPPAASLMPEPTPQASAPTAGAEERAHLSGLPQTRVYEKALEHLADPDKINEVLDQLAKQDFTKAFSKTNPPNPLQAEPLFGTFTGKIELFNDRAPWDLRLSVSVGNAAERRNPEYNYAIVVTKAPGHVSRSNGRGGLKGFSISSENPDMFFVEAGDDVLQLYRSKRFDGFNGLLYEGPNKFSMKATGRVLLNKAR